MTRLVIDRKTCGLGEPRVAGTVGPLGSGLGEPRVAGTVGPLGSGREAPTGERDRRSAGERARSAYWGTGP
jgi:hypothetical protein